jgi:hypothetical protein
MASSLELLARVEQRNDTPARGEREVWTRKGVK